MAKKTAGFNPVKTGVDPRANASKGEGSGRFLSIKDGEVVKVVPLVEAEEIISIEQCAIWLEEGNSPVWTYLGPEDPSHDLDIKRAYKAFLPVLTEDGEQKIWAMGRQNHSMVMEVAEAIGELAGVELRIKRTGQKLNTRYTVTQTGMRKDVSKQPEVDVISTLGPLTIEGVQEMIAEKLGKEDYDEVIAAYKGKRKVTSAKAGGTPRTKTTPVFEEDEELEEELQLS